MTNDLHNLLAVIHRDGGHHTEKVGLKRSVEDAAALVLSLRNPDNSLTHLVGDQARKLGLTLATAESLTGGNIAAEITAVSGSSAYFLGGVVAYTLEAKAEILGVDGKHAAQCNCVSERVAREMAAGVRNLIGADIGIATTGYAEPSDHTPMPMAHFAIDGGGWSTAGVIYGDAATSRIEMQKLVVQGVLRQLLSPAMPIIGAMKA
jgi:PncC family amidohydrolase